MAATNLAQAQLALGGNTSNPITNPNQSVAINGHGQQTYVNVPIHSGGGSSGNSTAGHPANQSIPNQINPVTGTPNVLNPASQPPANLSVPASQLATAQAVDLAKLGVIQATNTSTPAGAAYVSRFSSGSNLQNEAANLELQNAIQQRRPTYQEYTQTIVPAEKVTGTTTPVQVDAGNAQIIFSRLGSYFNKTFPSFSNDVKSLYNFGTQVYKDDLGFIAAAQNTFPKGDLTLIDFQNIGNKILANAYVQEAGQISGVTTIIKLNNKFVNALQQGQTSFSNDLTKLENVETGIKNPYLRYSTLIPTIVEQAFVDSIPLTPKSILITGASIGSFIAAPEIAIPAVIALGGYQIGTATDLKSLVYGSVTAGLGVLGAYDYATEETRIVKATRDIQQPRVLEVQREIGQDIIKGRYLITGEKTPPLEVYKISRFAKFTDKLLNTVYQTDKFNSAVLDKIIPAKEFIVYTPEDVIRIGGKTLPFNVVEIVSDSDVLKVSKIRGIGEEEVNLAIKFQSLSDTDRLALSKSIELKIGRPVNINDKAVLDLLAKNERINIGELTTEKLAKVKETSYTKRFIDKNGNFIERKTITGAKAEPEIDNGRRTSIIRTLTRSKTALENDQVEIIKSETVFSDVSLPSQSGQARVLPSQSLSGTTFILKEQIEPELPKDVIIFKPDRILPTPLDVFNNKPFEYVIKSKDIGEFRITEDTEKKIGQRYKTPNKTPFSVTFADDKVLEQINKQDLGLEKPKPVRTNLPKPNIEVNNLEDALKRQQSTENRITAKNKVNLENVAKLKGSLAGTIGLNKQLNPQAIKPISRTLNREISKEVTKNISKNISKEVSKEVTKNITKEMQKQEQKIISKQITKPTIKQKQIIDITNGFADLDNIGRKYLKANGSKNILLKNKKLTKKQKDTSTYVFDLTSLELNLTRRLKQSQVKNYIANRGDFRELIKIVK